MADIGTGTIGHPHNKMHYLSREGKALCGNKVSGSIYGDQWHGYAPNAYMRLSSERQWACKKCLSMSTMEIRAAQKREG